VADIANVIWVDAGAAKAAEASAITVARTKKVLAQNLPNEKNIEEQGELWDVGVIGSLYGSLLRPETLVLTVTSGSEAHLLHESCTGQPMGLALHLAVSTRLTGYRTSIEIPARQPYASY
jgi:hypothetical protein